VICCICSRSRRKLCLDRLIREPRSGTVHDDLLLGSVIAPIAFFETNQKEIMDHNLTLDQIFERFSGGDLHLEIHQHRLWKMKKSIITE
jgi:hypothetical protein